MEPDIERPYSGHRIDVSATVSLSRIGLVVLAAVDFRVHSAKLDYNWSGDGREENPPQVSLVEALAELLGLSFDDASELEDVEAQSNESDDGLIYGYVLDFTSTATPAVAKKIKKKHGTLSVDVPAHFFDRIHGRSAQATRYYVHGDQDESAADRFFCQQCDAMVESEHFEIKHPGAAQARYTGSLRRWNKRPARTKINLRRPNHAVNILAEIAESASKIEEASRSPFRRWIGQQTGRRDPVGDLARDIARDARFPVSASAVEQVRAYVERASRDRTVRKAFESAWAEFESAGPT